MTPRRPHAETPDQSGAFPRLSSEQIDALGRYGVRHQTRAGDVLFREGDRSCDLYVILEGTVALVEGHGEHDRVVGLHGPGRFLGEFNLLPGQAVVLTAIVDEPGAVLAVPADRLRELVTEDRALGDQILRAYLVRRSILIDLQTGFKIVGSPFSPATRRLREFASRNRLPHRWIDLERDRDAEALLRQLGIEPQDTPVVIWRQQVLRNPSNAELARMMGLPVPTSRETVCDLLVVGAGPAGLAAAVSGASEGLAVVALEGVAVGGQAGASSRIENYPGFPSGISGGELADLAVIQAAKFGAQLRVPAEAIALDATDARYVVTLDGDKTVTARSVLIATGARYRKLDVPHLPEYEATSVYYAATTVEAGLCRGARVAVVGGGNSAGQAALFLAQQAQQVRMVVLEDDLGQHMSRYLVDRIHRNASIEVLLHTKVWDLEGEGELEAVVVEEIQTGHRQTLAARALFVFVGSAPLTGWLSTRLALDDDGFVVTGCDAKPESDRRGEQRDRREPMALETSLPGVFAAGDVRSGSIKRVASAVGEGAMAVQLVHRYLA